MAGRGSLASQLAAIREVAPAEYDPEAAEYASSEARQRRDLEAGRSDYLAVGESQLRKKLESEQLGGRYAGVKSSRSELYNQQMNGSDGSEVDEELDGMSGEEDEDLEDGNSGEGSEALSGEDEEDESIPSEDDEEQGSATANPSSSRARQSKAVATTDEDSRQMLQELKKASSVEVDKGRAVRKQLSFWDTLLEARIRLQKCVTSMNLLPEPSSISDYTSADQSQAEATVTSLEDLSELLFNIRTELYSTNEHLKIPPSTRQKRKRGTAEYADALLDDLASITAATLPHARTTISKWSDKVSAASGGLANQQNNFKAIGTQNTLSQIETILSQDMDRLVERSRVRRAGQGTAKVVGRNEALQPVEGEKDVSKEVYDDTDFYQALLREVVDATSGTGMSNGMPGTAGAYASFNQVSRKKLANVDPKASKGRKLRYHVHEKLQNFMAPIPTLTWEKEQTDELFRGLLGGLGKVEVEDAQVDQIEDQPHAGGQLRIF